VLPEVATTGPAMQAQDRVHLNVGGWLFVTYRQTLAAEPHSLLARLGQLSAQRDATDQNGNIFIDRDGSQFRLILNFLRDGSCSLPSTDLAVEELLLEAHHYGVRAVYTLLPIEDVKSNIMNPNLLQVLGLVAFVDAHKALKARHSAESGTLPTSPIPVRSSLTFKECFTIVAVTYIAVTVAGAAIDAAGMREIIKLNKLETREMYKLRR